MSNKLAEIAEESAKGGFSLFLGNSSATFINALGAIIIARLLGPADYGLYSLSFVIPYLMVAVADFGMSPALTRYSAKLRAEDKTLQLASILRSGFSVKLLTGLLFLIVASTFSSELATSLLNRPEIKTYLTLASTLILFQAIYSAATSSLIGLNKMGEVSLMMVAQSVIRCFASPILILIGLSILGAVLGLISSFLVAASLGIFFLFLRHYKGLKKNSTEEKTRPENPALTMIKYGFPAYLAALLATLLTQYQNLVLAYFTSNTEIGNFNASVNFSALINLIAFPIMTVLFPAFSEIDPNRDKDSLKRMFTLTVKYASFLLVPSSLFVALLSKEFIILTYGGRYASAPLYLSLYMGIFLLTGLGYLILGNLFNGIGETRTTMNMTLITVIVFLPTAPFMTMLLQVEGLIVALIASTMLGAIYGLLQAWKKYRLRIDLRSESKIYAAAATASLPILALVSTSNLSAPVNMAVGGLFYLLLYLTAAALIGAVQEQDVMNLSQILDRVKIVNFIARPILSYEAQLLKLRNRLFSSKRRIGS